MRDVLQVAKALSDENRLRALITVKDGELCVCQIIQVLGLSPATVSKHMDILERAGLVQRRREGKWRFYRLADEDPTGPAGRALDWVLASLRGDPRMAADARQVRAIRKKDLEEVSACYRS
jgi:DNA-binding transcriptional ArsR family regulator